MAALTTQNIVAAGTKPTFSAASTSDTAEVGNGKNTFVVYRNSDASTEQVTIVAPGNNSYGQPNPDPVVTIPGGPGAELWVPLRKEYDAGDGSGRCTLTMASTTGITVAVVRIG